MKKFPFLLLDAGPIIGLHELGLWESFIGKVDVTITRTVAEQAKWASQDYQDIQIDIDSYEQQGVIKIEDIEPRKVEEFLDLFRQKYAVMIHDGEDETLAFLLASDKLWKVCAADKAVFRVLGLLGKGEQGISLEEILKAIGLSQEVEDKYTKRFRERWTREGEIDSIQDRGLKKT